MEDKYNQESLDGKLISQMRENGLGGEELRQQRVEWRKTEEERLGTSAVAQVQILQNLARLFLSAAEGASADHVDELTDRGLEELYDAREMASNMCGNSDLEIANLGRRLFDEIDTAVVSHGGVPGVRPQ